MNVRWLVTPYFFDEYDPALEKAVPKGARVRLNIPGYLADRTPGSLARTHRPIAAFVQEAARQGGVPVSIAGDCGAALPVMAGLQRAGLAPVVVWLDAHPDFNTAETSPTGFLGGMPLAMMAGRGDMELAAQTKLQPVPEADILLVGARETDPLEAQALEQSGITRLALEDLAALRFERPVYLHIDNDIVDAKEVPANNYPVAGGPSLAETMAQCADFAAHNTLCALSLSGWNGRMDEGGRTASACRRLLGAVVKAGRGSWLDGQHRKL